MGKTSILHQIHHYALDDPHKIALYCNWQPARDMHGLRNILLTSIQDSEDQVLVRQGISEKATRDWSFRRVLDQIVKKAREQDIRVLLLIDEPEDILLKLAETDPYLLKQLRQSSLREGLHTVIVSSPKLRELWNLPWATSPFWEGFDRRYIGPIEWEEAANLVRQAQSSSPLAVPDTLVQSILESTGQIPWLIQSVGNRLECDKQEPITEKLQVPDIVWSTHDYDERFETDYKSLSRNERCVLRSVGRLRRPSDVSKTAQDCGLPEAEVLKAWSFLEKLGYVKQNAPGCCMISNRFLNEWLAQGLWKSCEDEKEKLLTTDTVSRRQVAIAEEYERISILEPRPRGHEFQKLFASIAAHHGWSQDESVRTSNEEMDVIIHRGREYYLIECKWERDRVQARVIRELRGKLDNRTGVQGVVVSMSGFTSGAVQQVEDYVGSRVILLFGPEDVRSMVYESTALDDLLNKKYGALVSRKEALFS